MNKMENSTPLELKEKSVAIMQPYLFPYIGYFQLIQAVDQFVFYDDVNFIKNGWINRNRILINQEPKYITVQCIKASSFKKINETNIVNNHNKILKSIFFAYQKAPYFNEVYALIEKCLSSNTESISRLCIESIEYIANYLSIHTEFHVSSEVFPANAEKDRQMRIIHICKELEADRYINALGGKELYDKNTFKANDIALYFLKPQITTYEQFNHNFVPGLSIIDVLMFNSKEEIREMLNEYTLL